MHRFIRASIAAGILLTLHAALQAAAAEPDKAALAQKAQTVLKTHCYRCHGQDGANEGGFSYILEPQRLLATKKIVPGDADKSRLLKRVKKGEMPPEEEKVRPTEADIASLQQWIVAGAPDFRPAAPARRFIGQEEVLELIQKDLEKLNERDRRFIRYFTITHLFNAGWSEDELESYRHALSRLVNSLSWGRRVIRPQPIDPAKTVLRIDLRDYKWSETVWGTLIEAYPYTVSFATPAARYCCEATACSLPCVRVDWFVAVASRPPLYHDLLQLPATDRELEQQLHVNVEENIRQERVARAAFNGSGVSRNNRLIERHETNYGAYWKSYDFGGSVGQQNLFERPLGPYGKSTFQHDGGEIIFSLPNGLHGFMLVDGKGSRMDKGPTTVVSDPKQADRAVVNGLSCMSCHNRGMIEKNDQIRESVLKNQGAFEKAEADTILALYVPKKDFDKLLHEDAERFAKAVAECGGRMDKDGKPAGSDPVVTLALLFERELDLNLSAAEAGVKGEFLLKALDRSPRLGRALGALKVDGGTVQRTAFVDIFPELVNELGVGAAGTLKPAETGPVKPGERLFSRGSVVYLSDLPEFEVKNGEWPFAKDGTTGSTDKAQIKVQGTLSPKGLGMHPPRAPAYASVKYRLGKQAAVFKATVAINDTTNWCFSYATFEVWGDGKRLFESKKIDPAQRTQECTVDVNSVDVLELRVRVLNGNHGVHAVWVEPRLLRRADSKDTPGTAPASPPRPGERLFSRASVVYLADLPEFDVQKGEWPFAKDGTIGNNEKTRIKVRGYLSPKGLGMHPPGAPGLATVKYRLGKQAAVFKATVAINDSTNWCFSPAIFEVWGDGKRLFESKETSHTHERSYECSVDVSGVDVLELRVRVVNGNPGVHAVWVEPRLLRRADTKDIPWPNVKKLFEKGPREYLTDLAELDVKQGPWPLGKNGELGEGNKMIAINGKPSPKSLGLVPPSRGYAAVRYRLDKKAALFKGAVAIDDSGRGVFGAAVFEIHGDGKSLWQSKPLKEPRDIQEFSLNVSGVEVLELRVVAERPNHGLHAVWVEPRLLQRSNTPDK